MESVHSSQFNELIVMYIPERLYCQMGFGCSFPVLETPYLPGSVKLRLITMDDFVLRHSAEHLLHSKPRRCRWIGLIANAMLSGRPGVLEIC